MRFVSDFDASAARRRLIEHAAPRHRAQWAAADSLDPRVVERLVAAGDRWPTLAGADDEGWLQWLATRLPAELDAVAAIEAVHVDDLYLAWACCRGDSAAIAAFEQTFAREIRGAAHDATPSRRTEFEQHLRELLFVRGREKLRDYGGRGTLRSWLRITARRAYLNFARGVSRRREVSSDDDRVMDDAPSADPELAYLKEHYREAFRTAFGQAMAALGTRERNLLRQHLVHALNIDEIGALYDVHRSTAARWVSAARQAVLDGTRSRLGAALRVDAEELQSIMRLIGSRLDVTVSRHLQID